MTCEVDAGPSAAKREAASVRRQPAASKRFITAKPSASSSHGQAQNPIGGGRQVIDDHGGTQFIGRLPLAFGAVAGAHEQAFFNPGIPPAFDIDELVPEHETLGELDAEFGA